MFTVKLELDDRALKRWERAAERSPQLARTAFKRQAQRLAKKARALLRREPGKPKPGLTKLMTPKQRRAFWATNAWGRGIGAPRTHRLRDGWKIEYAPQPFGGIFEAVNTVPYREFVTGHRQQPFHTVTGWYQERTVADQLYREAQAQFYEVAEDRKSTRLNSSHRSLSRMPSSA